MKHLNDMVKTLVAQNQAQVQEQVQNKIPPPFNPLYPQNHPQMQTTVIFEIVFTPIPIVSTSASTQQRMLNGYPWGMPEGYLSVVEFVPPITPIMVSTSPIMHNGTFVKEPIYHNVALSDGLNIYDRIDGF